jgi:hypothetical protein
VYGPTTRATGQVESRRFLGKVLPREHLEIPFDNRQAFLFRHARLIEPSPLVAKTFDDVGAFRALLHPRPSVPDITIPETLGEFKLDHRKRNTQSRRDPRTSAEALATGKGPAPAFFMYPPKLQLWPWRLDDEIQEFQRIDIGLARMRSLLHNVRGMINQAARTRPIDATTSRKLNLGCGRFAKPGFIDIDWVKAPSFPGGYTGTHFVIRSVAFRWFAQPYLTKTVLPRPTYWAASEPSLTVSRTCPPSCALVFGVTTSGDSKRSPSSNKSRLRFDPHRLTPCAGWLPPISGA